MRNRILFLIVIILLSNLAFSQIPLSDKSITKIDSAIIVGKKYKAIYKTDDYLNIYNSTDSIIFKSKGFCPDFNFEDFNHDGNKDLLINYVNKSDSLKDLILFDPNDKNFKLVADFKKFPSPIAISGSKYYYSFHSIGCSDMDWESDLFYIDDFKAIRVGNITVKSCEKDNEKNGISIYKVYEIDKELIEKKTVDVLNKSKDFKWLFCLFYWKDNYPYFKNRQKLNCQKFRNGKFKILADSISPETKIIRNEDTQVETVENVKDSFVFNVKWINDCTYTLSPTTETSTLINLPEDAVITVRIIEVKENSYIQKSTSNFSSLELESEIFLIK